MNLSKSRYCNAMQCMKMLWLEKNKPEEKSKVENDRTLDNGNFVHEVARNLLGPSKIVPFNEDLSKMLVETQKLLEKDGVVAEASFLYENNFCSVDLLRKKGQDYEIYEVKSSSKVKEVYKIDLAYQVYVLNSLGYHVTKSFVVTINNSYVRKGDLELDKLFKINDLTEEIQERQNDISKNITKINKYMQQTKEPDEDVDLKCFSPYDCPFFNYCTRKLPKPNVFDLREVHLSKKISLYRDGFIDYPSLLKSSLADKYKKVIEYELYNLEDYVNKKALKDFFDTLSYPLYFLDFETFNDPIPPYDNLSPYERVPFQYSLHYIVDKELKHTEFLGKEGEDPRRKLAEKLVHDIPLNVCILAYNMSFEKGVIKKLASMYPDLANHLMNIYHNIKDLMTPFYKKDYYTKDMHGSYSIKYVLPALFPNDERFNYHNLDLVQNGVDAMDNFQALSKLDGKEKEYVRERLLRYCELDTYAMVKILEKLQEIELS